MMRALRFPGVNVGLFCATPSVALSRNVGRKAAFEMLVTGEFIDAPTAAAARARQSLRAGRASRSRRSIEAGGMRSPPSRRSVIAAGKALFYRQLRVGVWRRLPDCRPGDGLQYDR